MKQSHRYIATSILFVLLSAPGSSTAQQVYPSYGPPAQVSSGDQSRRQIQAQPAVEAASGQLAPAQPVDSVSIDYARVDGKTVTGFLAFPTYNYKSLPGLLLFPAWWGLNQNLRAFAERLAGAGYTVLAIDPFGGRIAPTARAARQLKQQALADPKALDDNIRQAYAYLKTHLHTLKMGAVGRDFGGDLALRASRLLSSRLQATVVWSASFKTGPATAADMNDPLLVLSGGADLISPPAPARAFVAKLHTLHKPAQLHLYPGVGHAFANPDGKSYDAAASGDAWRRTMAFFATHLKH